MKRFDEKNRIAVHVHTKNHSIDWEKVFIKSTEESYWKRRVLEAIMIQTHQNTMNLDFGLTLSRLWIPPL